PNKSSHTHVHATGGQYPVKLSVKSLFGDAHERPVNVSLDAGTASPPNIEAFDVAPICADSCVPATYRIASERSHAGTCVWSYADRDREVSTDTANPRERLVTFNMPGTYVLKLIAMSGKKATEVSRVVVVRDRPQGQAVVQLQITQETTRLEHKRDIYPLS